MEYIEEHSVKYEQNRIATLKTTYYDADYNKIGEINSDFSPGARFGSYDFTDERLQYRDGAKVQSDQIMVYSQKATEDRIKTKYLQRNSDQILGQGFHPFILENFEALLKGEAYTAKLVLPSQMSEFDVRIGKEKVENGRLQVRIEMDNWFLRLFAPHIEADYDIETRRLIAYRGVSAISNASGENVPVTIFYSYPPQRPMAGANSFRTPPPARQ